MKLHLDSVPLSGTLHIMPSKSASHRALICAALARGKSTVSPLQLSQDVTATLACLSALGLLQNAEQSPLPQTPGYVRCTFTGGQRYTGGALRTLDAGESGSTLRFLLPLALYGKGPVRFVGAPRLLERPLTPYRDLFEAQGVTWRQDASSLQVEGALSPGDYALPGDVSSQFITGLLYALPGLPGDSVIQLTTPLESAGYVNMTLEALRQAGVSVDFSGGQKLYIPGSQAFAPAAYTVPGDWSHAAFFLVAGVIAGRVSLTGLDLASAQGDRAIFDLLGQMGGQLHAEAQAIHAEKSALQGHIINVRDMPDLAPALCVAACATQGTTRIEGAARLRLKESDRLHAMAVELGKLGASIREEPEALEIQGGAPLRHAVVDSHNDHRIAMALAIAAPLCQGGLTLTGAEAVQKSAPHFFEEYASLGGAYHAGHLEP